jgi:hypothetical protein
MEEIRNVCSVVTGKRTVCILMPRHESNISWFIKNRVLDWFVHVLKMPTNLCEFTLVVV